MRRTFILYLSMGLALALTGASRAQDEKPPDYASKPLDKWIEALRDEKDSQIRKYARGALGPDGPYAKVAVPALIDAFNHKEPPVGLDAARTLADYGPPVVPSLVQALKRTEPSVRAGVAEALGYVVPKSREAVPALVEAMKDPVPNVRAAAAWSLGNIGRSAEQAIPALIAALPDNDDRVREAAAYALGKMGSKSKAAIPALILALKDKNSEVIHQSSRAGQAHFR